jgi:hypothetical protein
MYVNSKMKNINYKKKVVCSENQIKLTLIESVTRRDWEMISLQADKTSSENKLLSMAQQHLMISVSQWTLYLGSTLLVLSALFYPEPYCWSWAPMLVVRVQCWLWVPPLILTTSTGHKCSLYFLNTPCRFWAILLVLRSPWWYWVSLAGPECPLLVLSAVGVWQCLMLIIKTLKGYLFLNSHWSPLTVCVAHW